MILQNTSPLSQKIGVIGGGQLGKMMLLEAKKLGFYAVVLDPAPLCPAHSVCDEHIIAMFDDENAIRLLSEKTDIITYEFEHIGSKTLLMLENEGKTVYPTAKSLCVIQDKLKQKQALVNANIPVPSFMEINSLIDMEKAAGAFGLPFVLKTRAGGYDGKGNFVVKDLNLEHAYNSLGGGAIPLMAEKYVSFEMEVSVLACRAINGETAIYPVSQNIHLNSILDETIAPAPVSAQTAKDAMAIATAVMDVFGGVGMFCVEMFVSKNGAGTETIHVNEVAPRPHNSGHYSIEGCAASQFEQHIRAITGLPLGDASLIRPSVMKNILGEPGHDGKAVVKGVIEALSIKGVKLHIYGKQETKPYRKMGHLTATAETLEEAIKLANKAKAFVKIIAE